MIETFNENRKHFQEQLLHDTTGYYYRFTRNHIPYSIALVYMTEENISLHNFEKYLREGDKIIFLKTDLCAIIFNSAKVEQGIKASENFLARIQHISFSKHLYMAVVTANSDNSDFQTIYNLFDLLSYALDHNLDNSVVESSQVLRNG